MNKSIKASNGSALFNDLDERCKQCIVSRKAEYANIPCPKYNDNRRIGYFESKDGVIYACSNNSKTTKNFKTEFNAMVEMMPYMDKLSFQFQKEANIKNERRYQQLVHNLKSINAHCIQEIYELSPTVNIKDVRRAVSITKDLISKNLNQAALIIFHLLKYFTMMKNEFLVYDRTYDNHMELSFDTYKIRDVVMKILHMFFDDFTAKSVYVNIDENYDKVVLDYPSFSTALYYILENATKYVEPSSELNITFECKNGEYIVRIIMMSYYVSHDDRKHIFEEGYSGETALRLGTNGKGIGMYRAKKLLEQSGAKIIIDFGEDINNENGIEYSQNIFNIILPQNQFFPV